MTITIVDKIWAMKFGRFGSIACLISIIPGVELSANSIVKFSIFITQIKLV
ncbi:hypothetical protein SCLARK_00169 [Spiroplasma clarkii]|nr:hypothetical protein SCLARK_00169 [Spiroplasma clarkii]